MIFFFITFQMKMMKSKRLWRSDIPVMQLKIHSVVIASKSIHDKFSPSPKAIVIWLSRLEIAKIYPDNPVYPVH